MSLNLFHMLMPGLFHMTVLAKSDQILEPVCSAMREFLFVVDMEVSVRQSWHPAFRALVAIPLQNPIPPFVPIRGIIGPILEDRIFVAVDSFIKLAVKLIFGDIRLVLGSQRIHILVVFGHTPEVVLMTSAILMIGITDRLKGGVGEDHDHSNRE